MLLRSARSKPPGDPAAPGGPSLERRLWLTQAGTLGSLGLLGLVGCASAPPIPLPPKPTRISSLIKADAGLNPDIRKRASPLVLRVYELRSTAAFDAADFVSLYERDQATLGAEMVARDELIIKPGETRGWDKQPAADTRFIGMFGAFRDLDNARWKVTVGLVPNQTNLLSATIEPLALSLRRVLP